MQKEIVGKYSRELETFIRDVRKRLPDGGTGLTTGKLQEYIESEFFASDLCGIVEYSELSPVIQAVVSRFESKYGILNEYLVDPEINEIMINGPGHIFIERNRHLEEVDNAFLSEEELEGIIRMFASDVHREINEANPIVDARMKNGYRINGILRNVALNGPALTIRKFAEQMITMDDLVAYGSITEMCKQDLCALTESAYNIFISGGTSSGKTTMLNALASYIPRDARVVVIEDSAELQLTHLRNKVQLECRSPNSVGKGAVTMDQLIRTSLRMRPDRIVVGEVRGGEVVDMIQAMGTGHAGSLSTGHGNSIRGMLNRLETMYMMNADMPVYAIRNQIANAIEIFVHLKRDNQGRRRVVEVAEMAGFNGQEYELNYLYRLDEEENLVRTENHLKNRDNWRRGGFDDRL
jgi:pilus assembly protein CpaF